jgi:hypothetical protein
MNKSFEAIDKSVLAEANIAKMVDLFTNKLKGSDDKEKTEQLINYSYCWYLGLRGRDIFEEEIDTQDFLNNIWNCYGEFSQKRLREMLTSESRDICYSSRYRHIRDRPLSLSMEAGGLGIQVPTPYLQHFYSYHNEEIEKYLPPNVVITISDDGLYQIVKFIAFDDK